MKESRKRTRAIKISAGRRRIPVARGTFGSGTLVFIFLSLFLCGSFFGLIIWAAGQQGELGVVSVGTAVMLGIAAWAGWKLIKRRAERAEISLESIMYKGPLIRRTIRWADLLWIRWRFNGSCYVIVFVSKDESLRLHLCARMGTFVLRLAARRARAALLGDESHGAILSANRDLTPEQVLSFAKLRQHMLFRGIVQMSLAGLASGLFMIAGARGLLQSDKGWNQVLFQIPFCFLMSASFWVSACQSFQKVRNSLWKRGH